MMTAQQVGRFELRDFLGRGAIGDVYLAWDPRAQGEVALKVVRIRSEGRKNKRVTLELG